MKLNKLVCALVIGIGHGAWAAGNINLVKGEASVISRDGQPRAANKGDRVIEGETIATGAGAEVILLTDDSGVLAVRPMSRLVIEKYTITGTDKDSVVLNLLRGALRSVTGWINQTAPRNYRVQTATATIGIRGTDHETVIAEEGEPGTYDRVYSGQTSLETAQGSVFLQSGQTGQAKTRDTVPQLLPQAPSALYPTRETDTAVDALKQAAQTEQTQRLRTRQEQNTRSGGTSPQGNPVISAQCTPNSPAQRALDDFLRAYEQGNVAFIQRRLDPALIGYSTLINDIMRDANAQKQTQIRILDRQMQCGPDVSVIDFSWEKRFIDVVTFRPELQRGRVSVLISGLGAGLAGQWRISGFSGDNPLRTPPRPPVRASTSSPATSPATASTLQVSPAAISYAGIAGVCTHTGTANVSANRQYNISQNICAPMANGSCNFTSPVFPTTSVVGSSPSAVTICNPSGATVPTVTAVGASTVAFSGVPGSTVSLTSLVSIFGAFGINNVTANLTCNATVTISPSAPCTTPPTQIPVNFTVSDTARAGQATVPVQVVGSNGDRETVQLAATSPGNFSLITLPIQKGAAVVPGNGRLEFSGPVTFTLSYIGSDGVPITRQFIVTP